MAGDLDLLGAWDHIEESGLRHPEKAVALALLNHWSRQGKVFPSVKRLAERTSLGERTVKRAIATLEDCGAIVAKRARGKSNEYDLSPLASFVVPERHRCQSGTSATQAPDRGHTGPRLGPHRPPNKPNNKPKKEPRDLASHSSAQQTLLDEAQEPKTPSSHKQVTEHYIETFKRVRGESPIFGGREGKAVQDLLKKCQGDVMKASRCITNAFDRFGADTVSIIEIARNPAKYQGTARPPAKTTHAPHMQDDGVDVLSNWGRRFECPTPTSEI